jgi:hypothetical protein
MHAKPISRLVHHVSGAVERGEKVAVVDVMSRRQYVTLAQTMPLRWLVECIRDPGRMSAAHVLLLRVAMRRQQRKSHS